MRRHRIKRIAYAAFALAATLTTFVGCSKVLGETPIQSVVAAALDHSIETLIKGDTAYRSRKLIVERLHGPDLRDPNRGSTKFDLHHETTYERVLPNRERSVLATWREYDNEPGVRYPADDCDRTLLVIGADSFDQACDGSWSRSFVTKSSANVEADLGGLADVDALTRVDNDEHRDAVVAVYEGFDSQGGELRHVRFMMGLEDGVIRYAQISAATVVVEWEHFDLNATDIAIEAPVL